MMERVSLQTLPIELHTIIMCHLLSSCRQPVQQWSYNTATGPQLVENPQEVYEWIEEDLMSPSLFPYNAASAFRLWHDILAKIPECWTRVVFDVAKDPAPTLDAKFARSKDLTSIEVLVYSSASATQAHAKEERRRVKAILGALRRHIPRCRSIVFNIVYSASLPMPNLFFLQEAPHLEELKLECSVDNVDFRKVRPNQRQWHHYASFPNLTDISLTGFWFLYMVHHTHSGSSWLRGLELDCGSVSIQISHFEFLEAGGYSLDTFISFLSAIPGIWDLHLLDLTLSYTYDPTRTPFDIRYMMPCVFLHFESVSKSFLLHFDSLIDKHCYVGELTFEKCELPVGLKYLQPMECLNLADIIVNDHNAGLRDTVDSCHGVEVEISNCPTFGDEDLRWLGTPLEHLEYDARHGAKAYQYFPAERLMSLRIVDCPNISPYVVAECLRNRHDADIANDYGSDLKRIAVEGKDLRPLTDEEREILIDLRSSNIYATWGP